jgi:GxxExxY protein
MSHAPIPADDEELARKIIGAAIEVHRILGQGFLEKIYERALCRGLRLQRIPFESQKEIVVRYKDIVIPGQELDMLVGGRVIVELKAASEILPIHQAQLLSYLKAANLRLGLLVNFHV